MKWLNTEVCKTSIQRFESARRLHFLRKVMFTTGCVLECRASLQPEWRNGRRSRLKLGGPQGHGGSNPSSGTTRRQLGQARVAAAGGVAADTSPQPRPKSLMRLARRSGTGAGTASPVTTCARRSKRSAGRVRGAPMTIGTPSLTALR